MRKVVKKLTQNVKELPTEALIFLFFPRKTQIKFSQDSCKSNFYSSCMHNNQTDMYSRSYHELREVKPNRRSTMEEIISTKV